MNLLEIKDPSFLKTLSKKELISLANDIRFFLVENVSKTGGHLSSNLGVVELTIAMHTIFDTPNDKLIFDVGHQCYTHKILTGRANQFNTLRKYQGLTGFINKNESIYDVWESGHSSTSLSAQCGMLLANESKNKVVVLIGDSSIANGTAFEALNYMATLKKTAPIIILNDNKMSISKSVGAISRSFSKLRSTKFYQKTNNALVKIFPRFIRTICHRIKTSIKGLILKENIFEDMGYDYMGPYDGNDLSVCLKILKSAKELNKPCVLHFVTKKGKGYKLAEEDKNGNYHGIGPFDIKTGIAIKNTLPNQKSFSYLSAKIITKLVEEKDYYVITPAMIKGSELDTLQSKYPHKVLDVGIAEEHATIMASSLAQNHKKVVLMLYSTFSQRAYDYILNDIARTNSHVIIALDRCDLVSGDGSTHQGIYDISMFSSMPNITILAPKDYSELIASFIYADKISSPVAIRYSKAYIEEDNSSLITLEKPTWFTLKQGSDLTIITYGNNINYVLETIKDLPYNIEVIDALFINPLDEDKLKEILENNKPILIYENVIKQGSLSSLIYSYIIENNYQVKIKSMGLDKNTIVPTGDIESLRKLFNLDKDSIIKNIETLLKKI